MSQKNTSNLKKDSPKIQSTKTDFCVIGAGSGGLSFAAGAVQMGASVVLIEGKEMGGDCLNSGCVPSKALISVAKSLYENSRGGEFGWKSDKPKLDYKKVYEYVHEVISTLAPHDSQERFEKLGCKVIRAKAEFIDADLIKAGDHLIKAKRIVIATGSSPFIPPIKGLDEVNYHTNETIFDLKTLPKDLVVIGGGPIGIEMAQTFARMGSKVTVLEAFSALPKDDQDMVAELKDILAEEGVKILESVDIQEIKKSGRGAEVSFKHGGKAAKVKASILLVATGRRPNIHDLCLEKAGIEYSPRGILVDRFLRTTNKKAFAIGDCIGDYQFTHVAGYHAGLVIRNSIFRLRRTVQTIQIPWVTYTDPELAHVGYTQEELESQNVKHKVLQMGFAENDRAVAMRATKGKIKAYVSPKGKVLGCTILGKGAGELILPWGLAISGDMNISSLANLIAPYPTMSEISKRVAGSFFTDKIFSKKMKKLVRFLVRWM